MKDKQKTLIQGIFFGILGLISILILLILFPNFIIDVIHSHTRCNRVSATKSQIASTSDLLTNYYMDNGRYPSTSQGLKALLVKPEGPGWEEWDGPYTSSKNKPIDGWNRELHYRCPGIHNPDMYDLWSYGADNKPGGEKYDADIGNWSR